jgi:hypothetical protein
VQPNRTLRSPWLVHHFAFSEVLLTPVLLLQNPSRAHIPLPVSPCGRFNKELLMRAYPLNSPEAAARIVALVLIADGHVCRSEFDILTELNAAAELGLPTDGMPRVVQTLCEDLLMADSSNMLGTVDEASLASLMAEVDDPALQRKVLQFAAAAAQADTHLAEGEAVVMAAAQRHWGMGWPEASNSPRERLPEAA